VRHPNFTVKRDAPIRAPVRVWCGVKIKYFQDTDTLYIEFKASEVAETRDLDENTLLDLDHAGNICGIIVEHARDRADIPHFSFEQVAV
jgi:uncharacterized protein YuzE